MEAFFLTCVVVAFFVTKGRTDTAAYNSGKEPPGLVRARMRYAAGGGARTGSGRPVGRGAFGLLVASRWAEACRAAQHRGEHRAARRRAWFDETAPQRDARWRETQRRRLDRADRARARWAAARGLTTSTDDPGSTDSEPGSTGSTGSTGVPWRGRGARRNPDHPALDTTTGPGPGGPAPGTGQGPAQGPAQGPVQGRAQGRDQGERPSGPDGAGVFDVVGDTGDTGDTPVTTDDDSTAGGGPEAGAPPDSAAPGPAGVPVRPVSSTSGGNDMYEQAVTRLIAAADEVAAFAVNLAGFVDRLTGDGWGVEVTGPLADCGPALAAWEASYRAAAEQMTAQGDAGRAAYDQAPFVPGPHAVLT